MKILAIDTSTHVMGVALAEKGKLLGEYVTNFKKNHSLRLMPAIDHLLTEMEVSPKELDAIAVAKGPGSYTGVRIGVTTAKSMAWALDIPVYGISTLKMLAQNGRYFDGLICPFIDARRGQVYTGLYRLKEESPSETVIEDQIIPMEEWLSLLKEKEEEILFLSQDWEKHKDMIEELFPNQGMKGYFTDMIPKPGALALVAYQEDEAAEPHALVPEYAQLTEAEKNWIASKEGKQHE